MLVKLDPLNQSFLDLHVFKYLFDIQDKLVCIACCCGYIFVAAPMVCRGLRWVLVFYVVLGVLFIFAMIAPYNYPCMHVSGLNHCVYNNIQYYTQSLNFLLVCTELVIVSL